jgi:hypothetical protein
MYIGLRILRLQTRKDLQNLLGEWGGKSIKKWLINMLKLTNGYDLPKEK